MQTWAFHVNYKTEERCGKCGEPTGTGTRHTYTTFNMLRGWTGRDNVSGNTNYNQSIFNNVTTIIFQLKCKNEKETAT